MLHIQVKSDRYWPEEGQQQYGEIVVKLIREENMVDYIKRHFSVQKNGSAHIHHVIHFHYLAWPDQGVPSEPQTLLRIIREVNNLKGSFDSQKSPSVVHCRSDHSFIPCNQFFLTSLTI